MSPMSSTTGSASRTVAIALLACSSILMAGCASPRQPPDKDGEPYCFRVGRGHKRATCTQGAVPGRAVESEAKQFVARPDVLTLYIVRSRWRDLVYRVAVSIDDGQPIQTVPNSFVRIRLSPGEHQVVLQWKDVRQVIIVRGATGSIAFLELAGSTGLFHTEYGWANVSDVDAKRKITAAHLFADLDSPT